MLPGPDYYPVHVPCHGTHFNTTHSLAAAGEPPFLNSYKNSKDTVRSMYVSLCESNDFGHNYVQNCVSIIAQLIFVSRLRQGKSVRLIASIQYLQLSHTCSVSHGGSDYAICQSQAHHRSSVQYKVDKLSHNHDNRWDF